MHGSLRSQTYRDISAAAQGFSGYLFALPPARGYDQVPERRFEFIPLWGLPRNPIKRQVLSGAMMVPDSISIRGADRHSFGRQFDAPLLLDNPY
jgi:hypothetical protein